MTFRLRLDLLCFTHFLDNVRFFRSRGREFEWNSQIRSNSRSFALLSNRILFEYYSQTTTITNNASKKFRLHITGNGEWRIPLETNNIIVVLKMLFSVSVISNNFRIFQYFAIEYRIEASRVSRLLSSNRILIIRHFDVQLVKMRSFEVPE